MGNAILRRLRSHPGEMFSFGEDASCKKKEPFGSNVITLQLIVFQFRVHLGI